PSSAKLGDGRLLSPRRHTETDSAEGRGFHRHGHLAARSRARDGIRLVGRARCGQDHAGVSGHEHAARESVPSLGLSGASGPVLWCARSPIMKLALLRPPSWSLLSVGTVFCLACTSVETGTGHSPIVGSDAGAGGSGSGGVGSGGTSSGGTPNGGGTSGT